MQPNNFIAKIAPAAVKDMKHTGISASLTVAQAALESGWGGSRLTKQANNLFGIKGQGPAGSVMMSTIEYRLNGTPYRIIARFRAYHNWSESIADHSKLILNGTADDPTRYRDVINADYKMACRNIADDGYATDPEYANMLIDLIEQYGLQQYDRHAKPDIIVTVVLDGAKIARGTLVNDKVIVPVRIVAEVLGAEVDWNGRAAVVNEHEIKSSQLIYDKAYALVGEVVTAAGGQIIGWDGQKYIVTISK